MEDLNDKITGNDLTAAEWNQLPSEIQNVIEALGQTLSNGDLNQLGKGVAGYVANGNHYTDSGAADAYVLTQIGSKQASTAYTDGMIVEFVPANTNAGASTVNVASLGVKSISNTSSGGEILSGIRISLRYNDGSGEFEIFQTASVPVPAGLFFGLGCSNAADADHDITIAAGQTADITNTFLMILASAITKQLDEAWVAGNNQPGLFSGTIAADTTYFYFIIRKDSDGSIDAGYDTDIDASNIPSGYTAYRNIFQLVTDSSANIFLFTQTDDEVRYTSTKLDFSGTANTTAALSVMSVPTGYKCPCIVRFELSIDINGSAFGLITDPDITDESPGDTNCNISGGEAAGGFRNEGANETTIYTNTSGQLRRHYSTAGAGSNCTMRTVGYILRRTL